MKEAILLSAGMSSRMGSDKALLEINGKISICLVLDKLFQIVDKVYIILGANFSNVKKVVEDNYSSNKIEFIYNENHLQGMFTSVKKGFDAVSKKNVIVLQLIDQPFIDPKIYTNLAEAYKGNLIFQPSVLKNGRFRAGHPIIFAPEFAKILLEDKSSDNLRDVIKKLQHRRSFMEVEDSSILDNINTPKALEKKLNEIRR